MHISVCMCTNIHVSVYACVHLCICMCLCKSQCVPVCVHMSVCLHLCMPVHVCVHECVSMSVYVCSMPNIKFVSLACMPNESKSAKCETDMCTHLCVSISVYVCPNYKICIFDKYTMWAQKSKMWTFFKIHNWGLQLWFLKIKGFF